MESIWKKEVYLPEFSTMTGGTKVDTLIVGGGMAGLLCGYFLKKKGADYALIEQGRIAGGVTQNTTAKITAYHGIIYSKLLNTFGREKAAAYLQANTMALNQYRTLAKSIECDFEERDNYIYTMGDKGTILGELGAIENLGGKGIYEENPALPLDACCGIRSPGQAQFHPLKFAVAIAEEQRGHIYENTMLSDVHKSMNGWTAEIINGLGQELHLRADRIIITSHFPFIDRWGMYFMKMYQERSYVLALEQADIKEKPLSGMYIGIGKEPGNLLNLSFRTHGKYLLLGGGGGRTGSRYPAYDALKQTAKQLYPDSRVAAAWATQDCMTLDNMPYIGPYAKGKEGLLTATGFNKWGMTGSMTAAMILTGQMDNALAEVFTPHRSILRRQLAVNLFETGKNFLRPTAPRCTHLGCALKWNHHEKTWDCPCHGSRFAEGGRRIDNPAQVHLRK